MINCLYSVGGFTLYMPWFLGRILKIYCALFSCKLSIANFRKNIHILIIQSKYFVGFKKVNNWQNMHRQIVLYTVYSTVYLTFTQKFGGLLRIVFFTVVSWDQNWLYFVDIFASRTRSHIQKGFNPCTRRT
jgi:hypothetical protein